MFAKTLFDMGNTNTKKRTSMMSTYVPEEAHTQLKILATQKRLKIYELLEIILDDYLKKEGVNIQKKNPSAEKNVQAA